jgi:hypothetical protein
MLPTLDRYIAFLFGPFFRAWWAVVTGVASILSFAIVSPSGLTLSRLTVSLSVLFVSALIFLTGSALVQGWQLFRGRFTDLTVVSVQKCRDYGGDYLILLTGSVAGGRGALVEIKRVMGPVEAPFALVELLDRNAKGLHQGKPIWIAPGHLREFTQGEFSSADLIANSTIGADTIRGKIDSFSQSGV